MATKNAKCTITLNKLRVKELERAQQVALAKTAESIIKDLGQSETIPFDKGTLDNSTFSDGSNVENGEAAVVSAEPYARYVYYHPEYHFQTLEHANAQAGWFDTYADGGEKQDLAQKAFNAHFKREAGI